MLTSRSVKCLVSLNHICINKLISIPHLCSCWDHPRPALPGESDPSPALLSERPSGSLMVRALALGLFQRRGLHTTREVCRPAGNMRLPLPCLFVSPGKGLQI